MLAPISWLKEYVDIKMPTKELAWRLTELGLGVEGIKNVDGEEVLELEITPNRPDLLSIIGIAREISAIQNSQLKINKINLPKPSKKLALKINNDFKLFSRYTGIILDNVAIKPSPPWLQKKLLLIGLRPINNVVDITNFVMFETGIPLHAFDYKEIKGSEINVCQAQGGEDFESVDELKYKLPKGAIIIKDSQRLIDLCGIKGGLNSGIKQTTKTVYLQVTADDALLIRRASHALALRSDASAIFERGVDPGSLLSTLARAAQLILETSAAEIASDIIDISQKEFKSWNLNLRLSRLQQVTGLELPKETVLKILTSLSLSPKLSGDTINCTIPTYRGDLKIEEDLIEEVARVYGYNNYPLTIPSGSIPTTQVAYYKDYSLEEKIKQLLSSSGYNEIYTYSLISKAKLDKLCFPVELAIRVTNPINEDYEYLRPGLVANMLESIKINLANYNNVCLYEMGRVYLGSPPDTKEPTRLVIARNGDNFISLKGTVENLFLRLGYKTLGVKPLKEIDQNVISTFMDINKTVQLFLNGVNVGFIGKVKNSASINYGITEDIWVAGIEVEALKTMPVQIKYQSVPLYPALVEDLALIVKPKTYVGEIIETIKKVSDLIIDVTLLDAYANTKTVRVTYQDPQKTLSEKEVKPIREKILKLVEEKFGAKLKS